MEPAASAPRGVRPAPAALTLVALVLGAGGLLVGLAALTRGGLCVLGSEFVGELALPSGWSQAITPNPIGWSITFTSSADESVYLSAFCSPNAGQLLNAVGEYTEATEIGFADVGDEVIALRTSGEFGDSYDIWWRKGNSVAQLSTFSDTVDIDNLEELARALNDALP